MALPEVVINLTEEQLKHWDDAYPGGYFGHPMEKCEDCKEILKKFLGKLK